jgi:PAS domain S-box-containing protein
MSLAPLTTRRPRVFQVVNPATRVAVKPCVAAWALCPVNIGAPDADDVAVTAQPDGPVDATSEADRPARRSPGFRLTARVFWDLAIYMVTLGLIVGLVFPPFATALGVPGAYAGRMWFRTACLAAGFLVGAMSYAICRWVVGGRLAVLSRHLRHVAESVAQASRTGDWSASNSARIPVDSDDQLGKTARAFNGLLDALEAGQHFRSLIRNASDVITIIDASGRITYQTPSVGWVLGYPPGALVGTDLAGLIHPADVDAFDEGIAGAAAGMPAPAPVGCRMRHRNGSWRWTETVVNDLLHDPAVAGIVLSTRDVSDRRELEEQLRTQAFYDPLTELPNRVHFLERLRDAEEVLELHGTPLALLCLDMETSRRSTTTSVTRAVTGCCRRCAPASVTACDPVTCSPAWKATSSRCCCPARPPPVRRRVLRNGSWPRSPSRC